MRQLELLAPARDAEIGIAAIDCGADAVYIAGPRFGARQAAGNGIEDIRKLCSHAHRFGARVFVALNTILYDDELEAAYAQMLQVQEAGADAIIIQDMAILKMAGEGIANMKKDFYIPLHASTQCAIRTPEQARFLESLGFSRIILERELSLEQIRTIRDAVSCEIEFFVHGALCVCYSGQCYLSEHIAGRSANRGACIQACRSRYDLIDASGKVLIKDKALLSLKDFNLHDRLEDLAEAGICSFKIEGRLKNESYVKNIVRYYSEKLDQIVNDGFGRYERASFGKVKADFQPDPYKTFNRGYTELYLDGKRGKWAAMDAAKSMGEEIGTVSAISRDKSEITVRLSKKDIVLNNGDGFSFVDKGGNVTGFRGDVCKGNSIKGKGAANISIGTLLFRNINSAFEKELERHSSSKEIGVEVSLDFSKASHCWNMSLKAISEDGREVFINRDIEGDEAQNRERMLEVIKTQLGKTAEIYNFTVQNIVAPVGLPFMPASFLNALRREIAQELEKLPCRAKDILQRTLSFGENSHIPQKDVNYKTNISNKFALSVYKAAGAEEIKKAYELSPVADAELMRSRYCIRYELGLCPIHHNVKDSGPLFLLNNGRRLALHFDCRRCEMTVTSV